MNFFLIFSVAFVIVQASDWKERARHIQEQYENVKAVCANKHDMTKEEIKRMDGMEYPDTMRQKCVLECVLTEWGIMEFGRFSKAGSDRIAEYLYGDEPDDLVQALTVTKRCEKLVEAAKLDDSCEIAAETLQCLRKVSKQLNFKADTDY